MIEIGRAIVSIDLFEEHFLCDLAKCKGACCIEGDSGAPLLPEEAEIIESGYDAYKEYLPEEHLAEIKRQGFSVTDKDDDIVTPLVNNRQCVYSFYNENGILQCAIEKAFMEGKLSFRKPVSCHLFPIRINEYQHFEAVNYQKIDICKAGRACGSAHRLPLYIFLKEPLIRRYGNEWYRELEIAAGLWKSHPASKSYRKK
jgi:hypothetical protein